MLHFRMNMPFILMALSGSMMILIVLLLRSLLKNKLPKFVFPVLWCVILVRLLIPFSFSSPLSLKVSEHSLLSAPVSFVNDLLSNDTVWGTQIETAYDTAVYHSYADNSPVVECTADDIAITYAPGVNLYAFPWRTLLPIAYFLGLFLTAGILLLQKYRFSQKLKSSLLVEHNETINTLLREMGMGHILVFTNDEIASPFVCGIVSPHIYLPTRMDFCNTELLRHILAHETMHIKRRDNLIKAAMLAALCLNWFNPLVWLMSKCLSSDLETACDEAVLRRYHDEEQRKSYAFCLLAMAITGNRTTMLYSAFSKSEVEKRIKSILSYKKTSVLLLTAAITLMLCSTVVFATGIQAPFSPYLTSYCSSSNCRWGVRAEITRDIALGRNSQMRAENILLDILAADTTNNPELMEVKMKDALSDEFHVERSAFRFDFSLCLSDEEQLNEYAPWKITQDSQGRFLYEGSAIRSFTDHAGGIYQFYEDGLIDVTVQRDRYGYITDIDVQKRGN